MYKLERQYRGLRQFYLNKVSVTITTPGLPF